jgi:Zn-dependent protease with chaperone function
VPRAVAITAVAVGWDENESVLAVTEGALDALTRDELQGLVAHECSHIHEGDTQLNMKLAGMVTGLELVWRFGDFVRERGGLLGLVGTVVMAMGSFGWWAGRWLQAAVSRQREFLADARAVQWTRSRDGLGGVLRKALTQQAQGVSGPRWLPSAQHLLLVGDGMARGSWLKSHPSLQDRIRRVYGRAMPGLPLSQDAATPQTV